MPPFNSFFDSLRWAPFNLALYFILISFSWDITKWCKIYTEADSWLQKSHKKFGQLQTSSGKYKRLKFHEPFLSKRYIPSAKTLYTEDLSTLLSTTCSPTSLHHFWDNKSFFTAKFLCIFVAQTLHFFTKLAHQSENFQTFYFSC